MRRYSFSDFSDACHDISRSARRRINVYTRLDVSGFLERDLTSDNRYWQTLTDTARVLHYHGNQIIRHEASFVLAGFPYREELERCEAVRHLRLAIRRDPSIVAQHEATESIGERNLFCISSVGAAAYLAKVLKFRDAHPDVIKTAEESFDHLLRYLEREGYTDEVAELRLWVA